MTRDCFRSAVHRMRTEERRTQAGPCACDMQMHAVVFYGSIHKFVWEKRFSVRRMIHSYKWTTFSAYTRQYDALCMQHAAWRTNCKKRTEPVYPHILFHSFQRNSLFFGIFTRIENLTQGITCRTHSTISTS